MGLLSAYGPGRVLSLRLLPTSTFNLSPLLNLNDAASLLAMPPLLPPTGPPPHPDRPGGMRSGEWPMQRCGRCRESHRPPRPRRPRQLKGQPASLTSSCFCASRSGCLTFQAALTAANACCLECRRRSASSLAWLACPRCSPAWLICPPCSHRWLLPPTPRKGPLVPLTVQLSPRRVLRSTLPPRTLLRQGGGRYCRQTKLPPAVLLEGLACHQLCQWQTTRSRAG